MLQVFVVFFCSIGFLGTAVSGHMRLDRPRPLGLDDDPNYLGPLMKFYEQKPFPCRGHLNVLDTEPVAATWAAGSNQTFTLAGTTPHYGGSSQVSLSYDRGNTWKVLKSFVGSCPHRHPDDPQTFNFRVPSEAPSGDAIFAWSWFNREREMYHNCAKITVTGGGYGIDNLPNILVADINNGCLTPLTTAETKFPHPGEFVEYGDGEYPLELPTGTCV